MSMTQSVLELRQVNKTFPTANGPLSVLRDITVTLQQGLSVAMVGPSGSGKTTLLGICAGLDVPTGGEVLLLGNPISQLDEEARAAIRMAHVGFVFQNFQLIPTLTALENVSIPLELKGVPGVRNRALQLLDRVGLGERAQHYPVQLSGGEQQRVAIARALVANPSVLFADEPTGNLDSDTSTHIVELLFSIHQELSNTLILVTHDTDLAAKADVQLRMRNGSLLN